MVQILSSKITVAVLKYNYCRPICLHVTLAINMFFQAVMEHAARSRSMADLTDSTGGGAHASGTTHASGTATVHLSLLDLSGTR